MMIGQTLYRLNGNPCCNFIGQTPRRFVKRHWRFKIGVSEPFSYRFSNVFVDKKKIGAATVVLFYIQPGIEFKKTKR